MWPRMRARAAGSAGTRANVAAGACGLAGESGSDGMDLYCIRPGEASTVDSQDGARSCQRIRRSTAQVGLTVGCLTLQGSKTARVTHRLLRSSERGRSRCSRLLRWWCLLTLGRRIGRAMPPALCRDRRASPALCGAMDPPLDPREYQRGEGGSGAFLVDGSR